CLARKASAPSRIGIDEKSYGKGHRYMTLVFNHDNPGVDFIALAGGRSPWINITEA
ncbi:hypothetical protein B1B_07729, partial [mine drainage metagenome]